MKDGQQNDSGMEATLLKTFKAKLLQQAVKVVDVRITVDNNNEPVLSGFVAAESDKALAETILIRSIIVIR